MNLIFQISFVDVLRRVELSATLEVAGDYLSRFEPAIKNGLIDEKYGYRTSCENARA